MNQISKIEKELPSRTFRLPLETSKLAPTYEIPPVSEDWHELPDRYLERIKFASGFLGKDKRPHTEFVHVDGASAFGSDNITLVEYDIGGKCPYHAHAVKDVRVLKGFGNPNHVSLDSKQEHFRWANGNRLSRATPNNHFSCYPKQFKTILNAVDWSNMLQVDDNWRSHILKTFSFKPIRGEDGVLHFDSDRVSGGIFDHSPPLS